MDTDDDKIKTAVNQAIAEKLDYLFGINVNDGDVRVKCLLAMQLMLTEGRDEDLKFLRKLRVDHDDKDDQIKKTLWDSVRQLLSPILTAIAAALVSWLTFHRSN